MRLGFKVGQLAADQGKQVAILWRLPGQWDSESKHFSPKCSLLLGANQEERPECILYIGIINQYIIHGHFMMFVLQLFGCHLSRKARESWMSQSMQNESTAETHQVSFTCDALESGFTTLAFHCGSQARAGASFVWAWLDAEGYSVRRMHKCMKKIIC